MNLDELQNLIATGEGQLLEFKRAGIAHLGREICAFANSLGGRILIGVDNDGKIRPVLPNNNLLSEVQSIARNLEPPLMVECEEVAGVLIVSVPASRFKPHSTAGRFYLREGATCQQMNRDEIREFFYREGLVYFDEKTNERFNWPSDLNRAAYEEIIRVCGITPTLDPERLLENLGLLKQRLMSYAGSLLLCSTSSLVVPGSAVNCCLFQGKTTTRILDQKVYDADFLSNYQAAANYLLAHLNTAYEISFERKERLELPEGALREALLNAMGHRDYRRPGDLQVHIFQDRVEIVNPGGLVGGLTLETLGTRSIPRNPLLFGMMHRMNLVEKVGSGLLRIRQMCEAYPCPSPRIEADVDWYRIIFSRTEAENLTTTEQVGTKLRPESGQESRPESGLESKTAHSILKALETQPLQRAEIAKALGHGKVSGAINRAVKELLNKKLIEYTLPEKPNSRLQKYRLTEKGRQVVKHDS
ncbi:MAG: putative DNA binding domain-containing protein [Proteobacteria bacterium]|nr:putative DNA binding domain-containing protein [Pseudomonadota bacterium]MBU1717086.1 putative DNA binding domain-containing protein [Pseudomonadota bacterium]